ncbi:hydroxyisourate hydrolase, partial [Planktomarina temperata]|nr:hydroxyisourate hydrolase [Planktomarina temperata]
MNGFLTTHVLDTAKGCPAAGIRIELFRYDNGQAIKLGEAVTNADGRTDSPILSKEDFALGQYELVFHAGDYLRST